MPTAENDAGDWHTIDVGYVHTLTDDGECRPDCPHPSHTADYDALAERVRDVRRVFMFDLGNPLTDYARGFRDGAIKALDDALDMIADARVLPSERSSDE